MMENYSRRKTVSEWEFRWSERWWRRRKEEKEWTKTLSNPRSPRRFIASIQHFMRPSIDAIVCSHRRVESSFFCHPNPSTHDMFASVDAMLKSRVTRVSSHVLWRSSSKWWAHSFCHPTLLNHHLFTFFKREQTCPGTWDHVFVFCGTDSKNMNQSINK